MKFIVCISLTAVFTIMLGFSSQKVNSDLKEKRAKIVLLLDNYVCSEDQWVYLYGFKEWVSGNERVIFDSAFIEKGQHTVELQANIPIECEAAVLFSKNGPNFSLPMEPDSCVIMNIEESDGESFYYKKAVKGEFNNSLYAFWRERITYRSKLQDLISRDEKDSINHLKAEWFIRSMDRLKTAKLGHIVYDAYIILSIDFPEKKTEIKVLSKLLAKKFPEHLMLQESVSNRKLAPISEGSKKAGDRLFELRENRPQIDLLDLSLGNKLELAFFDIEGNKISTSSLGIDYTLVDFWASWCKPCRQETPTIKYALQKYPNNFAVYAVSLDDKRAAWQRAINEDSTQMFKHLIGTYPNGQRSRLLRQLNIEIIPTNFLIDNNQRIIAKDLHGERLLQVLDSLIQK
ncbi:TlpA disulfide reductase family protein [uncultured Bacteroides sp.]|uniref:TlpA family protein disulfide reductase n=1 Tax=uncultured Bacteroides sp. TaxID=162156 RepID=UPI0025E5100B|nr:TlpA disulfide reductase family protein [uncultured Bacteroides sp.]